MTIALSVRWRVGRPRASVRGGSERPPRRAGDIEGSIALGIRAALEVPLERLPSQSEVFYFNTSINGRFSNASARTVLGWKPKHGLKVGQSRTINTDIWVAFLPECQQ